MPVEISESAMLTRSLALDEDHEAGVERLDLLGTLTSASMWLRNCAIRYRQIRLKHYLTTEI